MEPARELFRTEWLASKKIAKLLCLTLVVAEAIGAAVIFLKLDSSPSAATPSPAVAAYIPIARSLSQSDGFQSNDGALALTDPESPGASLYISEPVAPSRITWPRPQTTGTANVAYRIASETLNSTHTHQLPVPDPLPSFEPPGSKYGYVIAEHFWDQQTYSVSNIVGLQRWAGWSGSRVVEPFLIGTKFKIPLGNSEEFHSNGTVSHLRMSDVYDLEHWNELSAEHHIPPLITWESFVKEAPRKVVVIDMNFTREACLDEDLSDRYKETLDMFGFYIVKRACIVLDTSKPLALADFIIKVFGTFLPQEVSVVFREWSYRIVSHIRSAPRIIHLGDHTHVRPSAMILGDAERYIDRYLPSKDGYTGVLLRTEWILRRSNEHQREVTLQTCLIKALGYLLAMRSHDALFLGMDVGKYGSESLADLRSDYVNKQITELFQALFPGSNMTISQWEHTFESVSHSRVPGYIAFLQKIVATQGNCLLLIGQGYFQRQALDMYKTLHRPSNYCYVSIDGWCRVMKKCL